MLNSLALKFLVLKDEKLLCCIITKTGNRFVISLHLRYALQYCNTKKFVIHLHEVTERIYLRGDKISEMCFEQPQYGAIIGMLL